MDKSKFPEERFPLEGEAGKNLFPYLGDNFEVLGPSTSNYNCIAHSLGKTDLWINPQTGPVDAPFIQMDEKYQAAGYERSDELCWEWESETSKIVLYATKSAEGGIQK
jgi:type VI secretion system secreted protein VgrG